MKKGLLLVAMIAGVLFSSRSDAQTMFGITGSNTIFMMSNPGTPSVINGPYAISGIASGQVLVGLDARASNGWLYAVGYDSLNTITQLYRINYSGTTFTATSVGIPTTSIDLGLTNNAAMDFIPTTDNQIRLIGRNGNNYLLNADDGSIAATGASGISFASGDLHVGTTIVGATAYTNGFYGADLSNQVAFDITNNTLVQMNAGTYLNNFNNAVNFTHSLAMTSGVLLMSGSSVGMDAWYDTLTGNNIIYLSGTALLGAGAHLYRYDMSTMTGALVDIGAIGTGTIDVQDIAFASVRDTTSAVSGHMLTGLSLNMRNLVFFDSHRPQVIRRMVRLSGLTTGQVMAGIDYSANGMLYGLGYNSTAHSYQLYTIDTLTGAATAVAGAGSLDLGTDDGSGNHVDIGFRFIASATDRIRVTGRNGAVNAQLDAVTGIVVSNDNVIKYVTGDANFGATANITSLAYTGYSGDTVTQMFGFDANTGSMVMFNQIDGTMGYGDGTSGFINTDASLGAVLSLLLHTSAYNNASMNISYDQLTATNYGYLSANYYGDSSLVPNYSILYDMTGMLTAYHKGTAGTPVMIGRIGTGTPVKDIALRRWALPPSTQAPFVAGNKMLVYPNPVQSATRIVMSERSTGMIYASILSMSGRVERTYKYAPGSAYLDVDMSILPVGQYNIQVSGTGIATTHLKVVKQ